MYTHYSLFSADNKTLADFEPMPEGGLPELLGDLCAHTQTMGPNYCVHIGDGCLHPGGDQISFKIGRGDQQLHLILMSKTAVETQFHELAGEGNASAGLAAKALASLG